MPTVKIEISISLDAANPKFPSASMRIDGREHLTTEGVASIAKLISDLAEDFRLSYINTAAGAE
jgi:hypothetical protein